MLYDYDHQWYRDTETPAAYVAPDKGRYNGSCIGIMTQALKCELSVSVTAREDKEHA